MHLLQPVGFGRQLIRLAQQGTVGRHRRRIVIDVIGEVETGPGTAAVSAAPRGAQRPDGRRRRPVGTMTSVFIHRRIRRSRRSRRNRHDRPGRVVPVHVGIFGQGIDHGPHVRGSGS